MTVVVNIRWGHLDRMPKCAHGRVEGFCACFERPYAGHSPHGRDVKQARFTSGRINVQPNSEDNS